MTRECCHNCLYAWWDLGQALQSFATGFPNRPACANHPDSLGRMRPTHIGEICRNYRPKPADPAKGAKQIPLGDGLYAYVDAADYEWLSQWTWHLEDGYAVRWEKGKRIYMHRQIMQPQEGMKVDHKNRNRSDNTRDNLRVCTHQENMYNRVKRAGSISRFKGVGFRKRDQKWYAELGKGGTHWFSFFDTEIEAARAYDLVAVQRFGEFANPNFPDEWPPQRRRGVHAKWLEEQQARQRTEDRRRRTVKRTRSRATSDEGQATKRSKKSRRATGHKPRATTPKKPRAETPGRRESKPATKKSTGKTRKRPRPKRR